MQLIHIYLCRRSSIDDGSKQQLVHIHLLQLTVNCEALALFCIVHACVLLCLWRLNSLGEPRESSQIGNCDVVVDVRGIDKSRKQITAPESHATRTNGLGHFVFFLFTVDLQDITHTGFAGKNPPVPGTTVRTRDVVRRSITLVEPGVRRHPFFFAQSESERETDIARRE